jgi:hypothetical protein
VEVYLMPVDGFRLDVWRRFNGGETSRMQRRFAPLIVLFALCLLWSGCGRQADDRDDFASLDVIREYRFATDVDEPQARWHPTQNLVVGRLPAGLVLMHERRTLWRYYETPDGAECWNPVWLDGETVLFGPNPHPRVDDRQGLLLPKSGLHMSRLSKRGLSKPEPVTTFGYAPRMWHEGIFTFQFGDQMNAWRVNGESEEPLGNGFDLVPQPNGRGLAWMDRPPIETDYWTGVIPPGTRIIRWREGVLSEVPGLVQVHWVAQEGRSGLYGTKLGRAPDAGAAWTTGEPAVGFLDGPHAEWRELLAGAWDPQLHPQQPWVAVTSSGIDGGEAGVYLYNMLNGASKLLLAGATNPRWNFNGERLMVELVTPQDQLVLVILVLGELIHDT